MTDLLEVINQERIICSCVRSADGENFFGKRHSDCLWLMRQFDVDYKNSIQGFYTSDHEFVTRKQAMEIAINAGQVSKIHAGLDLYSENLW
jgi:hypothetical protein